MATVFAADGVVGISIGALRELVQEAESRGNPVIPVLAVIQLQGARQCRHRFTPFLGQVSRINSPPDDQGGNDYNNEDEHGLVSTLRGVGAVHEKVDSNEIVSTIDLIVTSA